MFFGIYGPPFLTIARSLGRRGVNVHLLHPGGKEGSSRFIRSSTAFSTDLVCTDEGILEIKRHCRSVAADGLLSLSEVHLLWLSAHRQALEETCRLLISSDESLQLLLRSKSEQIALARAVGWQVLPTYEVFSKGDLESIPQEAYPVCLRPANPADTLPQFKVQLMQDPLQLASWLETIYIHAGGKLIVQSFKPVPNLVIHGISDQENEVRYMQGFLVARKFEGISLSVERMELSTAQEQRVRAFSKRAKLVGCYHFEALLCEDCDYFLEINLRFGGTTDKVARLGFDEPWLHLAVQLGLTAAEPKINGARVVNKRSVMKHLVAACKGNLSSLDFPVKGRFSHSVLSLRDLVVARDSIWDWDDLNASIRFHLGF